MGTSSAKDDKKMNAEAISAESGQRLAYQLRQIYGTNAEKKIQRDWGVAGSTARGWLAGKLPANKYLVAMCARYGKGFAAFVLTPCGDWTNEWAWEAKIEAMQAEMDELRKEIANRGSVS